jgi:hypothetical protein
MSQELNLHPFTTLKSDIYWYECVTVDSRNPKMPVIVPLKPFVHLSTAKENCSDWIVNSESPTSPKSPFW